MTTLNVLDGVVALEFGETITLTVVDTSGVAVNISAYDGTKQVTFRTKDGQTTVTNTLSFATDGSDGKVTFSFTAGQVTKAGEWTGQVKLRNAGETIISFSEPFTMNVIRNVWQST